MCGNPHKSTGTPGENMHNAAMTKYPPGTDDLDLSSHMRTGHFGFFSKRLPRSGRVLELDAASG